MKVIRDRGLSDMRQVIPEDFQTFESKMQMLVIGLNEG